MARPAVEDALLEAGERGDERVAVVVSLSLVGSGRGWR